MPSRHVLEPESYFLNDFYAGDGLICRLVYLGILECLEAAAPDLQNIWGFDGIPLVVKGS